MAAFVLRCVTCLCVTFGSLQSDAHHNKWNPAATHQHSTICTSHNLYFSRCQIFHVPHHKTTNKVTINGILIKLFVKHRAVHPLNTIWFWLTLSTMNSEKQFRSRKRLGRNTCVKRFIVDISWLDFANCQALFEPFFSLHVSNNYVFVYLRMNRLFVHVIGKHYCYCTCIHHQLSVWHRHCIAMKIYT